MARRTTSITSSHSPSIEVNIEDVSWGSPDARTTRTASATASLTDSSSGGVPSGRGPDGATLNATIMPLTVSPAASFVHVMNTSEPLPFDPIDRAAALWSERIGESRTMAAVTSVMRVQQILQQAVDAALRPHELTFARYEALVLLRFSRAGSLPMSTMGQRLQLHPTSITNIVDRLQKPGLVERRPHPTDGRTTLVAITEAGRERCEAATGAVTAADFGLVGLEPGEVESLTGLLARVRRAAGDFT